MISFESIGSKTESKRFPQGEIAAELRFCCYCAKRVSCCLSLTSLSFELGLGVFMKDVDMDIIFHYPLEGLDLII